MSHLTDAELVAARSTSFAKEAESILFERYKKLASDITRSFTVLGTEFEDLEAEAWCKCLDAIRTYQPEEGTQMKTWVRLTVTRRLMDVYDSARKGSRIPRALTLSLDHSATDTDSLSEMIAGEDDVLEDVLGCLGAEAVWSMLEDTKHVVRDLVDGDAVAVIARRYNISARAVWTTLMLSRIALKRANYVEFLGIFDSVRRYTPKQMDLMSGQDYIPEVVRDIIAYTAHYRVKTLVEGVLRDSARGSAPDEIVKDMGLSRKLVSQTLRMTRSFLERDAA